MFSSKEVCSLRLVLKMLICTEKWCQSPRKIFPIWKVKTFAEQQTALWYAEESPSKEVKGVWFNNTHHQGLWVELTGTLAFQEVKCFRKALLIPCRWSMRLILDCFVWRCQLVYTRILQQLCSSVENRNPFLMLTRDQCVLNVQRFYATGREDFLFVYNKSVVCPCFE